MDEKKINTDALAKSICSITVGEWIAYLEKSKQFQIMKVKEWMKLKRSKVLYESLEAYSSKLRRKGIDVIQFGITENSTVVFYGRKGDNIFQSERDLYTLVLVHLISDEKDTSTY